MFPNRRAPKRGVRRKITPPAAKRGSFRISSSMASDHFFSTLREKLPFAEWHNFAEIEIKMERLDERIGILEEALRGRMHIREEQIKQTEVQTEGAKRAAYGKLMEIELALKHQELKPHARQRLERERRDLHSAVKDMNSDPFMHTEFSIEKLREITKKLSAARSKRLQYMGEILELFGFEADIVKSRESLLRNNAGIRPK